MHTMRSFALIRYLLLFLLSFPVFAKDAILIWETSQVVDEFVIYHSINGVDQSPVNIAGALRTYRVNDLINGVHFFQVSAVIEGLESEKSDPVGAVDMKLQVVLELVDSE